MSIYQPGRGVIFAKDEGKTDNMKRQLFLFFLAGILSFAATETNAQNQDAPKNKFHYLYPVAMTSLDGGRFEILITTTEADTPITYKFDKYTGTVWELSNGFRPLKLIKYTREASPNDVVEEGKVNYQLVALSTSTIFLININSGEMWEKSTAEIFKKNTAFQIIKEQEPK